MLGKRVPRDRKKNRKAEKRNPSGPKPAPHPLYGNVPFIHHQTTGPKGNVYEWWQYDPDYQAPMPNGAIRGDVKKQNYCARAKSDIRADNPAGHVALARAIIEFHERTRQGDLNEAIAASRKAKEVWPDSVEPSLWEGIAHALAGRNDRARATLKSFLSRASNMPVVLRNKAERYLLQL